MKIASETLLLHSADQVCKNMDYHPNVYQGFFPNPEDCSSYYICQKRQWNLGYDAHLANCPKGKVSTNKVKLSQKSLLSTVLVPSLWHSKSYNLYKQVAKSCTKSQNFCN